MNLGCTKSEVLSKLFPSEVQDLPRMNEKKGDKEDKKKKRRSTKLKRSSTSSSKVKKNSVILTK